MKARIFSKGAMLVLALLLSFDYGASHYAKAQEGSHAVDVESGVCEDSTCVRRVMTIPSFSGSTYSTSSASPGSAASPSPVAPPAPSPTPIVVPPVVVPPVFAPPVFVPPVVVKPSLLMPGYNGKRYDAHSDTYTSNVDGYRFAESKLTYSNMGTWDIVRQGDVFSQTGPISGTWTNDPSEEYEYRVKSVEYVDGGANSGYMSFELSEPSFFPSPWYKIGPSTSFVRIWTRDELGCGFMYTIEVRSVKDPTISMTSKITITADVATWSLSCTHY
jgi:hypothetical protein